MWKEGPEWKEGRKVWGQGRCGRGWVGRVCAAKGVKGRWGSVGGCVQLGTVSYVKVKCVRIIPE